MVQVKQNHIISLIFFATLYVKDTASAKPLMNLLDILSVENIYHFHVLKFMHAWHNQLLPCMFNSMFQYARNVHNYNTRYASKLNLHKTKARTNTVKQAIPFTAIDRSLGIDNSIKPKITRQSFIF